MDKLQLKKGHHKLERISSDNQLPHMHFNNSLLPYKWHGIKVICLCPFMMNVFLMYTLARTPYAHVIRPTMPILQLTLCCCWCFFVYHTRIINEIWLFQFIRWHFTRNFVFFAFIFSLHFSFGIVLHETKTMNMWKRLRELSIYLNSPIQDMQHLLRKSLNKWSTGIFFFFELWIPLENEIFNWLPFYVGFWNFHFFLNIIQMRFDFHVVRQFYVMNKITEFV